MPVVFEQPQPMNQGISESVGALQQYERDREFALKQAQMQASMTQAAMHSASQDYATSSHANIASAGQELQRQGMSQQDRHFYAGLDAQQSMEQSRFGHQMALQDSQLSRTDEIRRNQLRNAVGTVRQMVASGEITQEQGDEHLSHIMGSLTPLERQKAQGQVEMQNMQLEQLRSQRTEDLAWENMSDDQKSAATEKRLLRLRNSETGLMETFTRGRNGELHPVRGAHEIPLQEYSRMEEQARQALQMELGRVPRDLEVRGRVGELMMRWRAELQGGRGGGGQQAPGGRPGGRQQPFRPEPEPPGGWPQNVYGGQTPTAPGSMYEWDQYGGQAPPAPGGQQAPGQQAPDAAQAAMPAIQQTIRSLETALRFLPASPFGIPDAPARVQTMQSLEAARMAQDLFQANQGRPFASWPAADRTQFQRAWEQARQQQGSQQAQAQGRQPFATPLQGNQPRVPTAPPEAPNPNQPQPSGLFQWARRALTND